MLCDRYEPVSQAVGGEREGERERQTEGEREREKEGGE